MAIEKTKYIKARKPARCGRKGLGCHAHIAKGEYHYRSILMTAPNEFPETVKFCAGCFESGLRQHADARQITEG